MSDLIRRDEILAKECCGRISANDVRQAPAVDAVEVVRCGDCKYWGDEEGIAEGLDFRYARCNVHNHFRYGEYIGWCPKEDDFCSYGERREENEVDFCSYGERREENEVD